MCSQTNTHFCTFQRKGWFKDLPPLHEAGTKHIDRIRIRLWKFSQRCHGIGSKFFQFQPSKWQSATLELSQLAAFHPALLLMCCYLLRASAAAPSKVSIKFTQMFKSCEDFFWWNSSGRLCSSLVHKWRLTSAVQHCREAPGAGGHEGNGGSCHQQWPWKQKLESQTETQHWHCWVLPLFWSGATRVIFYSGMKQ